MQIPDHVFDSIHKTETCWVWTKSTLVGGYGQVQIEGKKWTTHRLFYTYYKGEIPSGKLVCHTCDNPTCVNPDHLYIGTHKDNNNDTYNRNRMPLRYGDQATNVVKLSKEEALHIKYSSIKSKELEQKYNINQSQVSRIRNGKTWKNI